MEKGEGENGNEGLFSCFFFLGGFSYGYSLITFLLLLSYYFLITF